MEIARGRLLFLSALGIVLGLLGGAAAFVLLRVIGFLTNLMFFSRVEWTLPSFSNLHASPRIVIVAVAGSLVVSGLAVWCPMIKGHGIPEAMDAVLTKQSRIAPRAAIAKPVSAAIAIGTGGPFGAEGPIIVTGGAIGSLLGQAFHVSPAERKILLASGAAAGMAATFGTPLAAVILAIELLMFEFSVRVFVPLVVSAAVAGGVHAAVFGAAPLLHAPATAAVGLPRLPIFLVLGALCGLLAAALTKGLELVEDAFERLPVSPFWFPVIGAIGFGCIGLLQPRALGVGYDQINDVLLGKLTIGVVAGLALAKLFAWWIALGSGTSGGTLAPILLIGGAAGTIAAWAAGQVFPGLGVPASVMALVAMAATFAAATRAPFASMVFLFELTREYTIILPLMLGTVAAVLVYDAVMEESLLTMKLARRGLRIRSEFHLDPMRTTLVRDVMTADVRGLPVSATVADAREMVTTAGHGAFPLLDRARRVVGIVTRGDLLRSTSRDDAPVTEIASADVMTVGPGSSLLDVVEVMLEGSVEHVPVVDDAGVLVGICTRTDLLRAREPTLDSERRQRGWLGRGR
jgi:H+/Cl- antiporter ClcA/CBS domain-containing protein